MCLSRYEINVGMKFIVNVKIFGQTNVKNCSEYGLFIILTSLKEFLYWVLFQNNKHLKENNSK